jgi:hypothetical protein
MVSLGPYNQPFDLRQMYDFVDWKNPQKNHLSCITPKQSLMGILENNPNFSMFSKIIKNARLNLMFSDDQANYTLFVTPDHELIKHKFTHEIIDNMDIGTSRQIAFFSMLHNSIDQKLLQASPVGIFPTVDRSNTLKIFTISNVTTLQNNVNIIHFNYFATNGIIHVTDNLLISENTII